MAAIKCANCGTAVNAEVERCPECGADPRTGEGAAHAAAVDAPGGAATERRESGESESSVNPPTWLISVVFVVLLVVFAMPWEKRNYHEMNMYEAQHRGYSTSLAISPLFDPPGILSVNLGISYWVLILEAIVGATLGAVAATLLKRRRKREVYAHRSAAYDASAVLTGGQESVADATLEASAAPDRHRQRRRSVGRRPPRQGQG